MAILDGANLLFHEAGHPAVGLFSQRLMVYGGTMGQLTFPVILAVSFWRKGEAISFAASVIWFFENWLNIARYMADARVQVLPLVGGGCHDWGEIFGRWHVLSHDTQIAAVVRTTGWIGMSAACAWIVWLWRAGEVEAAKGVPRPRNPRPPERSIFDIWNSVFGVSVWVIPACRFWLRR